MDSDHSGSHRSYPSIKEESCEKRDLLDHGLPRTPPNPAPPQHPLCVSKEECAPPPDTHIPVSSDNEPHRTADIADACEEERAGDCASSSRTHLLCTSIDIKEESETGGAEDEYSVQTHYVPPPSDETRQAGEKPFLCAVCGKRFKCKHGYVNHQKLHSGAKNYSCAECGKSFIAKWYFTRHQNLHGEDRPYSCAECGKCFISNWHLVNHLKVHTGEKPFPCSECGKRFSTKSNLVTHRKYHVGARPHLCTDCGKSFVVRGSLLLHQKIHAEERPYSCSQCGRSFKNKQYLIRHTTIHTGEKPFPCSECGKRFKKKSYVVAHRKLHARGGGRSPVLNAGDVSAVTRRSRYTGKRTRGADRSLALNAGNVSLPTIGSSDIEKYTWEANPERGTRAASNA